MGITARFKVMAPVVKTGFSKDPPGTVGQVSFDLKDYPFCLASSNTRLSESECISLFAEISSSRGNLGRIQFQVWNPAGRRIYNNGFTCQSNWTFCWSWVAFGHHNGQVDKRGKYVALITTSQGNRGFTWDVKDTRTVAPPPDPDLIPLSGSCVSADGSVCDPGTVTQTCTDQFGNVREKCPKTQQCTFFEVPDGKIFELQELRTKISSTGNAEKINLFLDGQLLKTVVFGSTEPVFTPSQVKGKVMTSGSRLFFERFSASFPCDRYNASATFELVYKDITPPPAPPLELTLSANPTIIEESETVDFSAVGAGGVPPYTFNWNFGDGQLGSGVNVTHRFDQPGTFRVSCEVRDIDDMTLTKTIDITVNVKAPPLVLDISASSQSITEGDTVDFTAVGSGGEPPLIFTWDFGDGRIITREEASGPNVSHKFLTSGTFTVTCEVRDKRGTIQVKTLIVAVAAIPDLILTLSASAVSITKGDNVDFEAMALGGIPPYTFSWAFNDGATASGPIVNHLFNKIGDLLVSCQLKDSRGITITRFITIMVMPPPLLLEISADKIDILIGETVSFGAIPSGGEPPFSLDWDFGDGSIAAGPIVFHKFVTPGSFQVSCVVTDSLGTTITQFLNVTASSTPPPPPPPGEEEGLSLQEKILIGLAALGMGGIAIGAIVSRR